MKVFKFFMVFPFLAFLRREFSISSVGEFPLVFIVKKASEDEESFAVIFLPQSGGQ